MFRISVIVFLCIISTNTSAQQNVIPLYNSPAPGSENWTYQEQEYKVGSRDAITYNVSHPTLTVYPADPSQANGTAVIVCPGGGFYILAGVHEGTDVAQWLNKKGVTVFLLKYRLAHSLTDNPSKEIHRMV